MRAAQRIVVRAASGDYTVLCGRGTLARAGELVAGLGEHTGVFLLSSPRVWKHWGRALARSFRRAGGCNIILFDDRETSKNIRAVETLCRRLVRAGADRRAVLVAVGGGVVGDIAGFVAASYLRGVRLVHVPTTLVAQVDSAIGGKTGVNLPEGKNLVGAFYPPRLVLADPDVLQTLPQRQYRSGLYEVIKYGVIGDATLFRFLERRLDDLLRRDARITTLVSRVGPRPSLSGISAAELVKIMRADKKARGGRLRLVTPRRIGRVEVTESIPERLVGRVRQALTRSSATALGLR
ncbi:MAG: 3-dehydroquinate synthase [Acidobacteria bacterium]|nr:3-dehydroquinate synthase [Acidobacteriota bacterium]